MNDVRYLLVGGGLASANAAGTIRENDPEGSIMLVGWERHPPYDRPPFSKNFLLEDDMQPGSAASKPEDFYASNRVQLRTGVKVTKIDREARSATFEDGTTVRYEKLLLATGARPNPLPVPGHDLRGVHLLRTCDDSETIRTELRNCRRAVMVGSGFIGMEVASICAQRKLEVTVVAPEERPWQRFTSEALGGFLRQYYESRGVIFRFGEEVAGLEGTGTLTGVRLKSGEVIPADLAVVAVGVSMNTELAREAGLDMGERGCVRVDETLRTSDPNIWAAGDIAEFPDRTVGRRRHIEHYMNAMLQGETAGRNMAGKTEPFDQVAYFFSDVFDLSMILRGDPDAKKETRVLGALESAEFIELYPGENGALAMGIAFSRNYDSLEPISNQLEAAIRAGRPVSEITEQELKGG